MVAPGIEDTESHGRKATKRAPSNYDDRPIVKLLGKASASRLAEALRLCGRSSMRPMNQLLCRVLGREANLSI